MAFQAFIFLNHCRRDQINLHPSQIPLSANLTMTQTSHAIEKADTLIEALGWIRKFRDKTTVIKIGGSVIDDLDALRHILVDIVFMETVGMRPVIVHGAGKRISAAMAEAGIEPRFVEGRRYTDPATLEIVQRVLGQETNEQIAAELEQIGGRAMTLNSAENCVLHGVPLRLNGDTDLGLVGDVTQVDRLVIDNLCYAGQVPVIPSLCQSDHGWLNVNADTAAIEIAKQLGAEKLVILSDVAGVLRDANDATSLIPSLARQEATQLIESGAIVGGMIPKVEACLAALDHGVGKIHIVDGRLRHSLLLEIYTSTGVGTQIFDQ